MKRKPLEIKKRILQVLKENKELSLRELDIKVNTSYQTIRDQIEELEFFGLVNVIKHKKSSKTGRPYTSVKLNA
ncbi:MAG TPA: HTH domain-containing protein [Candidatus Nanoarchaeia archaeon]|nr:HTH domain-containing protein [Candidatus Nanoarchaeia archaeon]